ncbi:carboxypeptidase regulatory-like domain-containing protein [Candidatus Omnitrophota bacterium]
MFNKHMYFIYILILCLGVFLLVSCETVPTSVPYSEENIRLGSIEVTWEIHGTLSSPLRSADGTLSWETAEHYIYAKRTETTIEPPSDVQVTDIPDDNGHHLIISWTLSSSEETGLVTCYRIYRSRSETLTEPIPLCDFTSVDSLNSWDEHYTILVGTVNAGTKEFMDTVPLNGVSYYYWVQALGAGDVKSVTGIITDQDGNPVEGALIRLYNTDECVDMYIVSGTDGSYVFIDVLPGEYILVAKRDDYRIFSTTVIVE